MTYLEILKSELKPALGCTEPAAVALAVARAKELLGRAPERVQLKVSGNILKNAMGVGIPNTELHGIQVAAALSALAGCSVYGLEVLHDAGGEDAKLAAEMVAAGKVTVELSETEERLYIEARAVAGKDEALAIISGSHTNVIETRLNGEKVDSGAGEALAASGIGDEDEMTLHGIWEYAMHAPQEELDFLQETIDMNCAIAKAGLERDYGMCVGRNMLKDTACCPDQTDLATYISAMAAAASDARMSGCPLPVMSTTGSGNQGLTASLPVIAAAEKLHCSREKLLRALCLSELITIHIKRHIGKLSALCGCAIAASAGVACALTYLKGGNRENMYCAIQNMVADISGLICDGAKGTCSLKIATAVSGAVQCALLAKSGIAATEKDGIVEADVEKSIHNLARLGNQGMVETDRVILDMMICK